MGNDLEIIMHCQKQFKRDLSEKKILKYLHKLNDLEITLQDLIDTGIGKTVNQLSRHEGEVGQFAENLVARWKELVAENSDDDDDESESQSSSPASASENENDEDLDEEEDVGNVEVQSPPRAKASSSGDRKNGEHRHQNHKNQHHPGSEFSHNNDDMDSDVSDRLCIEEEAINNLVKEDAKLLLSGSSEIESDIDSENESQPIKEKYTHVDEIGATQPIVPHKSRTEYSHSSKISSNNNIESAKLKSDNNSKIMKVKVKVEPRESDDSSSYSDSNKKRKSESEYRSERHKTSKHVDSNHNYGSEKSKHHHEKNHHHQEKHDERKKHSNDHHEVKKDKDSNNTDRHSKHEKSSSDRSSTDKGRSKDRSETRDSKDKHKKEKDRKSKHEEAKVHRSSKDLKNSKPSTEIKVSQETRSELTNGYKDVKDVNSKHSSSKHREKSKEDRKDKKDHHHHDKHHDGHKKDKHRTTDHHSKKDRKKHDKDNDGEKHDRKRKSDDSDAKSSNVSCSSPERKKPKLVDASSKDKKSSSREKSQKSNINIDIAEEIDSVKSGVNFGELLGCLDQTLKKSSSSRKESKEKTSKHSSTTSSAKGNEGTKSARHDDSSKVLNDERNKKRHHAMESIIAPTMTISPNYKPPPTSSTATTGALLNRPSPLIKPPKPPNSSLGSLKTLGLCDAGNYWEDNKISLSNGLPERNAEDALSSMMASRNQRTKVFSGTKAGYKMGTAVPKLYDMCIQVLQDNIPDLGFTGGVPYDILKPVIERANVQQLLQIEEWNPYLIGETDELWKFHCNREFKGRNREELESWRELYERCVFEREQKFSIVRDKMLKKEAVAVPERKAKLTYVEPTGGPRFSRKKADTIKHGMRTLKIKEEKGPRKGVGTSASVGFNNPTDQTRIVVEQAVLINPESRAARKPAPSTSRRGGGNATGEESAAKAKPRRAPLMAKTMQFIKKLHRR